MTEFTKEERVRACQILGIRDVNGDSIPLKDRTVEALLITMELRANRAEDNHIANQAAIKALEERLKIARKAKRLANRRADTAMAAVRLFLDKMGSLTAEEK